MSYEKLSTDDVCLPHVSAPPAQHERHLARTCDVHSARASGCCCCCCCSPKCSRYLCTGCMFLLGLLCLLLGILSLIFIEPLLTSFINQMLTFSPSSSMFNNWRKPAVLIKTRFYLMNLTNPEQFLAGARPNFTELGPYTVGETWERRNVTFYPNGTMSTRLHRSVRFLPEFSVGSDSDRIVTIRVSFMSFLQKYKYESVIAQLKSNALVRVFKITPLIYENVSNFLFGHEDSLVKMAKYISNGPMHEKFGIYVGKNNSLADELLVRTGSDDWTRTAFIERFRGSRSFNVWKGASCNKVQGSDGSIYSPGFARNVTQYLFLPDFCRTLALRYTKSVMYDDIEAWRFEPPRNVFSTSKQNIENACYCLDKIPCAPDGLFNISACKFGSPTYISFPHFYNADKTLLDQVIGLNPNKEKHGTFADIVPRVGVAMKAKIRFQINIYVQNISSVNGAETLPNLYYPLAWIEGGLDSMPESTVKMVGQAVFAPSSARRILSLIFFLLAAVFLLSSVFWFLYAKFRASKKVSSSIEGRGSKQVVEFKSTKAVITIKDPESDNSHQEVEERAVESDKLMPTNGQALGVSV